MSKQQKSKLDAFAARLDEWFTPTDHGGRGLTLAQAQQELRQDGCQVSLSRLSAWWEARQQQRLQDRLLSQIASGARQVAAVDKQFGKNPPPELETLIKLHRVLILQLSTKATADPALISIADQAMRTVMEFTSGRTKADIEKAKLGIQERRVTLLEKKAAAYDRAQNVIKESKGGITPATLTKIERELKLL